MSKNGIALILTLILTGAILFLSGCDSPVPIPGTTDVYIGGLYADVSEYLPCYWKNEVFNYLPTLGFVTGNVKSIYVSGPDIYCAGSVQAGIGASFPAKPCLWINNGKLVPLKALDDTKNGYAQSVVVSNGNIYIAGYCKNSFDHDLPCVWQSILTNQDPMILSIPDTATDGYVQAVQVTNGNVYVAGYTKNSGSGLKTPCIWEIGAGRSDFTGLSSTKNSTADCLYIYDDNRFIGGTSVNNSNVGMPGYWKNEVWQTPTLPVVEDTYGGDITAISADAKNVYAAGDCFSSKGWVPSVWINGTRTNLDKGLYLTGRVSGLYVSDGDVYICGYLDLAGQPCYWKNGARTMLPVPNFATAYPYTIFAVRH